MKTQELQSSKLQQLEREAKQIRKRFLSMHFQAKAGHIGSGLSCIDFLTYLYGHRLRTQDSFILSKGHSASALYATFEEYKIFSPEQIESYYKDGTLLPAHPQPVAHQAIPIATGSLGHGLSMATGMAYYHKYLNQTDKKIVCLLSDGECNEGSVWEAALFLAHHRLNNLVVAIDANGLQGFGRTSETLSTSPLIEKWKAFGFHAIQIDGHSFIQMERAFIELESGNRNDSPACIILNTVKGKGVSFMEDKLDWHYLPMSESQYHIALKELQGEHAS